MNTKRIKVDKKHKKSILRNLVCSLIKHERIETTDVKAKALNAVMHKIFSLIYDPALDNNKRQIEIKRIIHQKGAYDKLMNNLKGKVSAYRGQEIRYFFSRVRYSSCSRMYNIEFVKNKFKRKEEKMQRYFDELVNNPMLNHEKNLKQQKLYKLLNQHLLLSNILKKIYSELESVNKKEKPQVANKEKDKSKEKLKQKNAENEKINETEIVFTKKIIFDTCIKVFKLLPSVIRDSQIEKVILFEIETLEDNNIPQSGKDFLLVFKNILSRINTDINFLKSCLEELNEISKDRSKIEKFNRKFYEIYYKNELADFKVGFDSLYNELHRSKQGIKKIISDLKTKENEVKENAHKFALLKTNYHEELDLIKLNKPSKAEKEYLNSYKRNYISGEESGLSDMEDLQNKPQELIALKNEFSEEFNINRENGRKVVKINKRL